MYTTSKIQNVKVRSTLLYLCVLSVLVMIVWFKVMSFGYRGDLLPMMYFQTWLLSIFLILPSYIWLLLWDKYFGNKAATTVGYPPKGTFFFSL